MKRLRVLLVDDHEGIREAVKGLLRACGLKVTGEATDGNAALTECERLTPDVVLMDITMPGISGLKVLPSVREKLPFSAIIILTTHDDQLYRDEAFRLGADAYVLKWQAPSELIPAIHNAFAAQKERARNQV